MTDAERDVVEAVVAVLYMTYSEEIDPEELAVALDATATPVVSDAVAPVVTTPVPPARAKIEAVANAVALALTI